MRILDRYVARQLIPVWFWCLAIFIFLSCLIDLFGHLDELVRYHVPLHEVLTYYLNFIPLVFVKASPLALLISAAFISTRMVRYQELLAMSASGTSLMRGGVPFLFVGWVVCLIVFAVNDFIIPRTALVYEQLRQETFRSEKEQTIIENVAMVDNFNRLYHARELNVPAHELKDLTVLEHDWHNRPTKSLYAQRAIWTSHGWLLLHGTLYRTNPQGQLQGEPEPFMERVISYPVTPDSFKGPDAKPEIMRFGQLRLLITRLKHIGLTNVRRCDVELASKLTVPFMNVIACLMGFVGSTQPQLRGHLRGLGMGLGWGLLYYVVVAISQGIGKEGFLPVIIAVWTPHFLALWWCVRRLKT